jgi:hypothetical protein
MIITVGWFATRSRKDVETVASLRDIRDGMIGPIQYVVAISNHATNSLRHLAGRIKRSRLIACYFISRFEKLIQFSESGNQDARIGITGEQCFNILTLIHTQFAIDISRKQDLVNTVFIGHDQALINCSQREVKGPCLYNDLDYLLFLRS